MKKYSSLIIATIITIISIVVILLKPSITNADGSVTKHIVPGTLIYTLLGCIIVSISAYLIKGNLWQYFYLILLGLSFFFIIEFSTYSIFIGLGIQVNLVSLFLLIVFLTTNSNLVPKFSSFFSHSNNNDNEYLVERFKKKYAQKSVDELQQIQNNNNFSEEAKKAGGYLLETKIN